MSPEQRAECERTRKARKDAQARAVRAQAETRKARAAVMAAVSALESRAATEALEFARYERADDKHRAACVAAGILPEQLK